VWLEKRYPKKENLPIQLLIRILIWLGTSYKSLPCKCRHISLHELGKLYTNLLLLLCKEAMSSFGLVSCGRKMLSFGLVSSQTQHLLASMLLDEAQHVHQGTSMT
jgi:hypothetical protein